MDVMRNLMESGDVKVVEQAGLFWSLYLDENRGDAFCFRLE
jgi:hypothetical protein